MKPEAIATLHKLIELMVRIGEADEAARLRELLAAIPPSRGRGRAPMNTPAPDRTRPKKTNRTRPTFERSQAPGFLAQEAGEKGSPILQAQALPKGGA